MAMNNLKVCPGAWKSYFGKCALCTNTANSSQWGISCLVDIYRVSPEKGGSFLTGKNFPFLWTKVCFFLNWLKRLPPQKKLQYLRSTAQKQKWKVLVLLIKKVCFSFSPVLTSGALYGHSNKDPSFMFMWKKNDQVIKVKRKSVQRMKFGSFNEGLYGCFTTFNNLTKHSMTTNNESHTILRWFGQSK